MKYRVMMSVAIDATSDVEANDHAERLLKLLREPFVKMAVEGKGIRLVAEPVVHRPQREIA